MDLNSWVNARVIIEFAKGHNSVKNLDGVMVLFLSTMSDDTLQYLIGFRVTDLNSRVDARVVANVDGRMYGRIYA